MSQKGLNHAVTPAQVEGLFYPLCEYIPIRASLFKDENSLLTVPRLCVTGQLLTNSTDTLSGYRIEVWQADHKGVYDHPESCLHGRTTTSEFLYHAATLTDSMGGYQFVTLKPAPYNDHGDWRTPHIHFKVFDLNGKHCLTTQMYFAGESLNSQDSHLCSLDVDEQSRLIVHPKETAGDCGKQRILHCHHNLVLDCLGVING